MHSRALSALNELHHSHASIFQRFPLSRIADAFERLPPEQPYNSIPSGVLSTWNNLLTEAGAAGQDISRRALLLFYISQFDVRANDKRYTDAVRAHFDRSLERIFRLATTPTPSQYTVDSSNYIRDLAICRQRLFPVSGGRVIEPYSGYSRSLVYRGGIRQAFDLSKIILRHGNYPYYQSHLNNFELDQYTSSGCIDYYLDVAEMLSINPSTRGLFGASWLLDPYLAEISPHLAYVRQVPNENGGHLFFTEIDRSGNALVKSSTRRALYHSGKYVPKVYTVIWTRDSLIHWAYSQNHD